MNIRELPLANEIISIFEKQGIKELFPPQASAIPYALNGDNLVMAVPTAAGKSLVAYCTMLQGALEGKKSMYLVPLRALASEKYEDLKIFEDIGIKVGLAIGDYDTKGEYLGNYDILVCTSEKADSLLRHTPDWIYDIRIVVADEVHLINDTTRGPTMEVNLARFMLMQPKQLISLSATIKNAEELSDWLDAKLIKTDWRPIPLKQGVLNKNTIYFTDGKEKLLSSSNLEGLVSDVLSENGQALIFVNTRKSSESTASRIMAITKKYCKADSIADLTSLADKVLRDETNILSKKLSVCLAAGVAFHHAGLSNHHRRIVEENFRNGLIKCIVATPTLAAGINIPARRVIIRNLWRYSGATGGMSPIPVLEIKQMMGRAGRPGYDEYGEAIIIIKNELEKERVFDDYLLAESEPIFSKLASKPALRMHLLSIIATRFAISWEDILKFMKKTFYVHQLGAVPEDILWDILDFLERNEFITTSGNKWEATLFGNKTASLYLDPLSSLILRNALEKKIGSAFSYLHTVCSTPDMRCLFVHRKDNWIEEKMKEEQLLIDIPTVYEQEYEWILEQIKTASLIEDWIEERKEDYMITKYGIGPGDIHAKVETAEWLLYSMRELARIFNFDAVSLLSNLRLRVLYGCKDELLDLVSLKGVGRVRARTLYKNGFKSISMIRKTNVDYLSTLPGIGVLVARQIMDQVK